MLSIPKTDSKNKIQAKEVATNAFEIFKANENAITFGAFGCCGLTIQDKLTQDYLLAHIGQELILSKPLADQTVESILRSWNEAGYDIQNSNINIIHDCKIQNIFPDISPNELDKTFSDAFCNNKFVMGIPCNEFLDEAFQRKKLVTNIQSQYNSNICEFLQKSYNGTLSLKQDDETIKTDIAIINGKLHFQNTDTNNKVFIKGDSEIFNNIDVIKSKEHNVAFTQEMAEGLPKEGLPAFGTQINPFDATALHIKTILKNNPDKTLGTLNGKDVKVLLQAAFQVKNQNPQTPQTQLHKMPKIKISRISAMKIPHYQKSTISSLNKSVTKQ